MFIRRSGIHYRNRWEKNRPVYASFDPFQTRVLELSSQLHTFASTSSRARLMALFPLQSRPTDEDNRWGKAEERRQTWACTEERSRPHRGVNVRGGRASCATSSLSPLLLYFKAAARRRGIKTPLQLKTSGEMMIEQEEREKKVWPREPFLVIDGKLTGRPDALCF